MAMTRNKWIAIAVLVVLAGAAAFVLTSGDKPIIELAASQNVIKIEAAAVEYSGWPEMSVNVNGERIGLLAIDQPQRKIYTVDVPNAVGAISKIELQFTNDTDCSKAARHSFQECVDRSIVIRSVHLNDEKLESGEPSGKNNTIYSLRSSEGGITWQIDG